MDKDSKSYEENFAILEEISTALNKDEIGMDELMDKSKTALKAAKKCLEILNTQRGEFKKIESEFKDILEKSNFDEPGSSNDATD